jgi:hypothetical protein
MSRGRDEAEGGGEGEVDSQVVTIYLLCDIRGEAQH